LPEPIEPIEFLQQMAPCWTRGLALRLGRRTHCGMTGEV
jgi:hypothetical protein